MANHGHNQRAQFRRHSQQPIGTITRGTTGFNRLRKVDRWVFYHPELRRKLRPHAVAAPLAIDVGYGDSYTGVVVTSHKPAHIGGWVGD